MPCDTSGTKSNKKKKISAFVGLIFYLGETNKKN